MSNLSRRGPRSVWNQQEQALYCFVAINDKPWRGKNNLNYVRQTIKRSLYTVLTCVTISISISFSLSYYHRSERQDKRKHTYSMYVYI